MTYSIKFSHKYIKMPFDEDNIVPDTKLLQVLITTKKELSQAFIEYDTKYFNARKGEYGSDDYYPLPDGPLIVLVLWSAGELWTTVRRWTAEKEAFYRSLQGQMVGTEIKEAPE